MPDTKTAPTVFDSLVDAIRRGAVVTIKPERVTVVAEFEGMQLRVAKVPLVELFARLAGVDPAGVLVPPEIPPPPDGPEPQRIREGVKPATVKS